MTTTADAPSPDWEALMRHALDQLSSALLRVGVIATGMACTPEEQQRLQLCMQETAEGLAVATIQELRLDITQITRKAAVMAQAAVSKAAAAPDDSRR